MVKCFWRERRWKCAWVEETIGINNWLWVGNKEWEERETWMWKIGSMVRKEKDSNWALSLLAQMAKNIRGGSDSKESTCKVGDLGLISRLGRFPGGGHGNPLQCSYLENFMDRGARKATVHGVAKSRTWLSN